MADVHFGNAGQDAPAHRGWIVGSFMPEGILQQGVEIKWGRHMAGEGRADWAPGSHQTTILLLVSGRFRLDLPGQAVTLAKQGDYVMWGPDIEHSWQAEEDSVMVTVRWPSTPPKESP